MRVKKSIKFASALLSVVLLTGLFGTGLLVSGSSADIQSAGELGGYSHYNGIIFGIFEAQTADAEGALAIGGPAHLGIRNGYDVGASASGGYTYVSIGKYQNPGGYPSLLLAEAPVTYGNHVGVYGGPMVLPESSRSDYTGGVSGSVKTATDSLVNSFFTDAQRELTELVQTLNTANTRHSVQLADISGWNVNKNTVYSAANLAAMSPDNLPLPDGLSMLVLNIHSQSHAAIDAFQLADAFGGYDIVVLNFPDAKSVRFSGSEPWVEGSQLNPTVPGWYNNAATRLLEKYAGKLVWNFPAAQSVQISGTGVVGSLLAPGAYVEGSGGSVNGMLVADSFKTTNGCELHGFKINDRIFELGRVHGSIELTKTDEATGHLLAGAGFLLYRRDGSAWTLLPAGGIAGATDADNAYFTDSYGRLRIEQLAAGDYRLVEAIPPEGYLNTGWEQAFTISRTSGVSSPLAFSATNRLAVTSLTLRKQSAEDGTPLAGARFLVYKSDQYNAGTADTPDLRLDMHLVDPDLQSGSGGLIQLENLTAGFYYLLEFDAPEGYRVDDHRVIQIQVDNGADGLPAVQGVYELAVNLDDYDLDNLVGIENDGSIPKTRIQPDGQVYPLTNQKETRLGHLRLLKLDADGSLPLAGAVFSLSRSELDAGSYLPYATLTTNAFGVAEIDGLPYGDYRLEETAPPSGYTLSGNSPYYFRLEEGSAGFEITPLFQNPPLTADLRLSKTDGEGSPLDGAAFALYKSHLEGDGSLQLTALRGLVSGVLNNVGDPPANPATGALELKDLSAGHYYLVETSAPEGYLLAENQLIQVHMELVGSGAAQRLVPHVYLLTIENPEDFDRNSLGDVESAVVQSRVTLEAPYELVNTPKTGSVELYKHREGDTDAPLAGVEFTLYKQVDGGYVEAPGGLAGPHSTGPTGRLFIEGLAYGAYRLVETGALPGYGGMGITVDFAISESSPAFFAPVANPRLSAEVTLHKTDGTDPLDGAVFSLYRSESSGGNALRLRHIEDTASVGGEVTFAGLLPGFYYFAETQAPDGYLPDDAIYQIQVTAGDGRLDTRLYRLNDITMGEIDPGNLGEFERDEALGKIEITGPLTVENRPAAPDISGRLVVRKQDAETGHGLEGALFTLYPSDDGSTYDPNDPRALEKASGGNGILVFDDLAIGTYFLVETQAPAGYAGDATVWTVDITAEAVYWYLAVENVRPAPAPIEVLLQKIDEQANGLDDAGFYLYKSEPGANGPVLRRLGSLTSGNSGEIKLENLTEGYYYLAEHTPPPGYLPSGQVYQIVVSEDSDALHAMVYHLKVDISGWDISSLTELELPGSVGVGKEEETGGGGYAAFVPNTAEPPPTGRLRLLKLDAESRDVLAGAEFTLTLDGAPYPDIATTYKTNAMGTLIIDGLPYGEYRLTEVTAPAGYEMDPSPMTLDFVVGEGSGANEAVEHDYEVTNRRQALNLTFTKVSEAGGTLPGAEFTLYRSARNDGGSLRMERVKDYTSDSSGLVALEGLHEGFYYLVESQAPAGHYLPGSLYALQIRVYRPAPGEPLVLEVHELDLPQEGLDLNNIPNESGWLGGRIELTEANGDYSGTIRNAVTPPVFGSMTLRKLDDRGNSLQGAVYTLYRLDGGEKRYGRYTTNALGLLAVNNLPEGAYRLEETRPPAGFTADSPGPFLFTINGSTQEFHFQDSNTQIKGSLRVVKMGLDPDASGNTIYLPGTVFEVYAWSGYPSLLLGAATPTGPAAELMAGLPHLAATLTTDAKGEATLDGLDHGWYTVVEVEAPDGYYLDGKIIDTLYVGGEAVTAGAQTTEFVNSKIWGEVEVLKYVAPEDGAAGPPAPLEGVLFELSRYDMLQRDFLPLLEACTDSSGYLLLENLEEGMYKLCEMENPNPGFEGRLDEEHIFIISEERKLLDDDGPITIAFGIHNTPFAEPVASLALRKVDVADASYPLAGARFELDRLENGEYLRINPYEDYVTDVGGRTAFDWLTAGSYRIREVTAPQGYARPAEPVPFTLAFDEAGIPVFSFSALPQGAAFDAANGLYTLTLPNTEAVSVPGLRILKVDGSLAYGSEGYTALAGAEFDLEYRAEADHAYTHYATVLSGRGGVLLMPDLRAGQYRLTETKAPEGYLLDEDRVFEFAVTVDAAGTLTGHYNGTVLADDPDALLFIVNRPAEPGDPPPEGGGNGGGEGNGGSPATGDGSSASLYALAALGALLCLLALVGLQLMRQHKQRYF